MIVKTRITSTITKTTVPQNIIVFQRAVTSRLLSVVGRNVEFG